MQWAFQWAFEIKWAGCQYQEWAMMHTIGHTYCFSVSARKDASGCPSCPQQCQCQRPRGHTLGKPKHRSRGRHPGDTLHASASQTVVQVTRQREGKRCVIWFYVNRAKNLPESWYNTVLTSKKWFRVRSPRPLQRTSPPCPFQTIDWNKIGTIQQNCAFKHPDSLPSWFDLAVIVLNLIRSHKPYHLVFFPRNELILRHHSQPSVNIGTLGYFGHVSVIQSRPRLSETKKTWR